MVAMCDFSRQILRASELGNLVTIRALLPKVETDEADQGGNTCLMYAAKEGHVSIVRLLLKQGAHPDKVNSYGWTATMQASASGHVRCVKCLLEHGADTKLENHFNQTAVVLAAAHGHNDIVQSLVAVMSPSDGNCGEDVWLMGQFSEALSYAAYYGNISTVKILLHLNADICRTIRDTSWTPLLFALLSGDLPTCRTLLGSPGLATLQSNLLLEVVRATSCEQKMELMGILADTMSITDSSKAISSAIENGDLKALQQVIGLVDDQSNKLMGGTPLMFASVTGQAEIVKWLLEVGCDINAQDENNHWTALMQAVFHGHYRVVELLLFAGADPEIGNVDGLNAHIIANMLNDSHLTEMLIKYCRVPSASAGKKWWGKLTSKFSTIRALSAFKGKLKEQRERSAADEETKQSNSGELDLHAEPHDTLFAMDTRTAESSWPIEGCEESSSRVEDCSAYEGKAQLTLTHSHVIEVKPRKAEEETVLPELEDVVAEDLESGEDVRHNPIMLPTESELLSPDSGFMSRGANSIPLDSQIIQSDYDGLDVDIPELPAELDILEPDYMEWCPHNPQLTEQMVRDMGAPDQVVKEFKQLNLLLEE